MSVIEEYSSKYPKLLLFITIPFYSIFSFLWFRKAKLNITEHLVMNCYRAAAELIVALAFGVVMIFCHNKEVLYMLYSITGVVVLLYAAWFYYQYFSVFGYKKYSLVLRSILVPVSVNLFVFIAGVLLAGIMLLLGHK